MKPPRDFSNAKIRFGMLLTTALQAPLMDWSFCQTCNMACSSSAILVARCSFTFCFSRAQIFSMQLASGLYGGHSRRRTPASWNRSNVLLALCGGALSCWNHCMDQANGKTCSSKILQYLLESIEPRNTTIGPGPFTSMQPQTNSFFWKALCCFVWLKVVGWCFWRRTNCPAELLSNEIYVSSENTVPFQSCC